MTTANSASFVAELIAVAHLLRVGKEVHGSKQLRSCLHELEKRLSNLNNKQRILSLLPQMLAAQERSDWLALADYLEYELPHLLINDEKPNH